MMTDPIADLLTRVRNGNHARKECVAMPWSRLKEQIARVMAASGYIGDVVVRGEAQAKRLELSLRYDRGRSPVITGLTRVSKPSLRVYVGAKEIEPVRHGLGTSILSTSKGVMDGKQARQEGVGGEVLCHVW